MSILDMLMGGAAGGSMMDMAKQGGQQMSILQMLGLDGSTTPTSGAASASVLDPKLQSGGSSLADIGRSLSNYGAGMSQASGPSRMPVDFGQAMAGGNAGLQAGQDNQTNNRLKEAQMGALGQRGKPDLEASAQNALVKLKMGAPLSPEEQAQLQAFDTMNQAKLTYNQDPNGQFRANPAARSILPPGMSGGAPPQGSGQQIDPRQRLEQLRRLKQQSGM